MKGVRTSRKSDGRTASVICQVPGSDSSVSWRTKLPVPFFTALRAVMPPSSRHAGGVNMLMGDGSVKFVKDSVSLPAWRGLGTIAGGEVISADAF